jgi:hypothetical protein
MRKSIIAGLTWFAAVMSFAGQSHAYVSQPGCVAGDAGRADCRTSLDRCAVDGKNRGFGGLCIHNAFDDAAKGPVIDLASLKDSRPVKHVRSKRKQPGQVVETPEPPTIPQYPLVRDCIRIHFPQCSPQ